MFTVFWFVFFLTACPPLEVRKRGRGMEVRIVWSTFGVLEWLNELPDLSSKLKRSENCFHVLSSYIWCNHRRWVCALSSFERFLCHVKTGHVSGGSLPFLLLLLRTFSNVDFYNFEVVGDLWMSALLVLVIFVFHLNSAVRIYHWPAYNVTCASSTEKQDYVFVFETSRSFFVTGDTRDLGLGTVT